MPAHRHVPFLTRVVPILVDPVLDDALRHPWGLAPQELFSLLGKKGLEHMRALLLHSAKEESRLRTIDFPDSLGRLYKLGWLEEQDMLAHTSSPVELESSYKDGRREFTRVTFVVARRNWLIGADTSASGGIPCLMPHLSDLKIRLEFERNCSSIIHPSVWHIAKYMRKLLMPQMAT